MARRYYRRRPRRFTRRLKTVKWSVENYCFTDAINAGQQYNVPLIPPTNVLGVRKVKNFTLVIDSSTTCPFAVVFVPEGTNPNPITVGQGQMLSFYEPNQNVIIRGISNSALPSNWFSRLSRNLNPGDSVFLNILNMDQVNQTDFKFTISYSICFS